MFHVTKFKQSSFKVPTRQSLRNIHSSVSANSKFSIGDYIIGKQIGQGAYAIVKEGIHKETGKKYAIKIYEKFRISGEDKRKNIESEINILKTIEHENIAKLYDSVDTPKQIFLILEYAHGISLLNYTKKKYHRKLSEDECRVIFRQIVSAVEYCHSKGISHRDIKMDNIIIDRSLHIKLIDFGFSTVTKEKLKVFCGTPSYMCPEIVSKEPYYGEKADLWALGILLFTLHVGYYPFRAMNDRELFRKIRKGLYDAPDSIPKLARKLISKVLIVDANKRINAATLMNDEYITEGNMIVQDHEAMKCRCYAIYGKDIIDKLVIV